MEKVDTEIFYAPHDIENDVYCDGALVLSQILFPLCNI